MHKLTLILGLIGMWSCSMVVKPVYIDPETDLVCRLQKNFEILKTKPTKQMVSTVLNDAYTYTQRMNAKLQKNNARAKL